MFCLRSPRLRAVTPVIIPYIFLPRNRALWYTLGMEKIIHEKAYAKLNLTLGVTGKRADGYHLLDSLMLTTSLCDELTVERSNDVLITVTGATLPYRNTVRSAVEYYRALTGRGAAVRLKKRIPSEAGLGGGSADAAAVLRALDRLYGDTDEQTLYAIALKVGADVPFCLKGGLCRARGIGELLEPLPIGGPLHFVIAKPAQGVSTKALFTALQLPCPMPDNLAAARALQAGDAKALAPLLFNALEAPARACVPDIAVIEEKLLSLGALGVCMSGSGSAVFGLFPGAEQARAAEQALAGEPVCAFAQAVRSV